ncbi:hypothetical protein Fmac_002952 [Flemingia macrophylla]|uniref:Uncharacterized protein n=1 Tax=Flemingia macrophylla TaxID=520843 RepID=A0ABD1NLG4_9FABA
MSSCQQLSYKLYFKVHKRLLVEIAFEGGRWVRNCRMSEMIVMSPMFELLATFGQGEKH